MSSTAVIGTGYVALTTGACLAHLEHEVVCADVVARDLWPAILVELGVLRNRRVIRLLETLKLAAHRPPRPLWWSPRDSVTIRSAEGYRRPRCT